eukprot:scaffold1008_cov96-Isochrysis_galbana.AAC.5
MGGGLGAQVPLVGGGGVCSGDTAGGLQAGGGGKSGKEVKTGVGWVRGAGDPVGWGGKAGWDEHWMCRSRSAWLHRERGMATGLRYAVCERGSAMPYGTRGWWSMWVWRSHLQPEALLSLRGRLGVGVALGGLGLAQPPLQTQRPDPLMLQLIVQRLLPLLQLANVRAGRCQVHALVQRVVSGRVAAGGLDPDLVGHTVHLLAKHRLPCLGLRHHLAGQCPVVACGRAADRARSAGRKARRGQAAAGAAAGGRQCLAGASPDGRDRPAAAPG